LRSPEPPTTRNERLTTSDVLKPPTPPTTKREKKRDPRQKNQRKQKLPRQRNLPATKKSPLNREVFPILTDPPILRNRSPPIDQKREKARTSRKIVKKNAKNTKKAQKVRAFYQFLPKNTKKLQKIPFFLPQMRPKSTNLRQSESHSSIRK
jgi:hypothetical protein